MGDRLLHARLFMRMPKLPPIRCHPLTPDRWDDFETLFGPRGACGGCWCMLWRLQRSEFERNKGERNRQAMRDLVDNGVSPGILAYRKRDPIGWCALAPRADYPALARSRILKPIDDQPVWSVSCLFVHKDHRKQGVSVALLRAATDFVRKQGGTVVEGYPVLPKKAEMPAVFAWTGIASAFLEAGFHEAARPAEHRPIMRCVVEKG